MALGNPNSKLAKTSLRVAIVDYGMGNVRSVQCALERLNCVAEITSEEKDLSESDALILPGVGAFGKAMENLRERKLLKTLNKEVIEKKKPILGICLGMQLFAETSGEIGRHVGLGWVPGSVELINIEGKNLSLPHVGWNNPIVNEDPTLFRGIDSDANFYFDHSFHLKCKQEHIMAMVDYGSPLVSGVRKGWIMGVQFHPEKSQTAGLKLLRNFLNFAEEKVLC